MKISVITINYNNCYGLQATIESVISQTYNDFEFIVIDGGSTDGSADVIKKYSEHIAYWVSEKDSGIYNAMNKGVSHAHGGYCIFINSGDCFYSPNVLEIVVGKGLLSDIVIGKVSIDDKDNIISPPPIGELTFYHLYAGAIPHQGSFIKTELLRNHPYDESLKISSDWKFFVQAIILDNCSVTYIDDFVAKYDMTGFSTENPELMRKEKEIVLAEMFPARVLADYQRMKLSECTTQLLTPELRRHGQIDRFLYRIGKCILRFFNR